jgi:predicted dienelactone hydrolase/ABC-type amino acid transport substrate-binding protein
MIVKSAPSWRFSFHCPSNAAGLPPMMLNRSRKSVFQRNAWIGADSWCVAIALGCSMGLSMVMPASVRAANKVSAIYGPLEVSVSVKDIETFVKTGTMADSLKTYAQILGPKQQLELRSVLQETLQADTIALERFGSTTMGKNLLKRLSNVLQVDPGQDGGALLFKGMLSAAKDPQGLSVLSLIRRFPADTLRIKVEPLLTAQKELTGLLKYRDSTILAISKAMTAESPPTPKVDFALKTDLRQPGLIPFVHKTLDLSNNRARQSLLGRRIGTKFEVELYLPEKQSQPSPLLVISHGLGSDPNDFSYLAEHLASYGFAVAVPQHIGSDTKRLESILDGRATGDVSPVEFIDRPLDVKYLLDELTRLSSTDPEFKGRLNLQQIGAIGHSFGGYTALALAGANINHERLREQCVDTQPTFNLSLILQCRANLLPPFSYNLADPRIKAVIAIDPLTSAIFGPEGMGDIRIPVMMVSGSHDVVTPSVLEQVHPFLWINTPTKYLALLSNAGHTFSISTPQRRESLSASVKGLQLLLSGTAPELSREYLQALSVAFMQTYVGGQPEAQSYLNGNYVKYITRKPVKLGLVRSLTPAQLQQAYGGPLPIPIVPPSATAVAPSRAVSVLQTVQKTGVLKAGIRDDAAPFGSFEAKKQATGYCVDLLNLMTQKLQTQLNTPIKLKLVPSSLPKRFAMVQDGQVQLECGPNTITADPTLKTSFSTPFFITGTHFLVKTANQTRLDPKNFPPNITLGTYQQTTTAKFIEQQYPKVKKTYFEGPTAQTDGWNALSTGKIDALAGDGILLVTALGQKKLTGNPFTLVPEQPLTCDAYGLILPAGDRPWENTVNQIIGSREARGVWDKWFKTLYPYIYLNVDYCADRP